MSSYQIAVLALIAGLAGQAIAGGLAGERCLRGQCQAGDRFLWLVLAGGALLLTLAHVQALELAVHTGLHDLRQALLTGGGGLLYAIAVGGLSRRP